MIWLTDSEGTKFALNPRHIVSVLPYEKGQPRVMITTTDNALHIGVGDIDLIVHQITRALNVNV